MVCFLCRNAITYIAYLNMLQNFLYHNWTPVCMYDDTLLQHCGMTPVFPRQRICCGDQASWPQMSPHLTILHVSLVLSAMCFLCQT
jgi:hypothetical protein